MKDSLTSGLDMSRTYVVEDEMSPPHLPVKVLSTPAMVGLIEGTCLEGVAPHLDAGETTVGTHISVSHTGPAMSGEEVVVDATLEAIEKRRLRFAVEVRSPRGAISTGTHERAVVDASRFG
ncbi:MAG: thioesterase family protein [Thermoanaerobaculia bacterium]|nr:thioesterase family protein [Thermoanaerobaculia bacterium]